MEVKNSSKKLEVTGDVALFIDLDNVVIGAGEARVTFDIQVLLTHLKEIAGDRLVLRRAYADWRQQSKLPRSLAAAGFELQASVNFMSKNLADMQLVVDAMETLVDGYNFSTYVLVTGDRDFLPLVQTLRKRGKKVIGVGVKHTSSKTLQNLCDSFVYYDELIREHNGKVLNGESLLKQAVAQLLADQERVPASMIKQAMYDLSHGGFSQTKEGKMGFKQFLLSHPKLVEVSREDTTLFVQKPQSKNGQSPKPIENGLEKAKKLQPSKQKKLSEMPLYMQYRTELKKRYLRIVPAKIRLLLIKDIVELLQIHDEMPWRRLVQAVYDRHQSQAGNEISKSYVGDVLKLLEQSEVIIHKTKEGRFSVAAPVFLAIASNRLFQEAVMRSDACYLSRLQEFELPFSWEQVSVALYDTTGRDRYLKVLQEHYAKANSENIMIAV